MLYALSFLLCAFFFFAFLDGVSVIADVYLFFESHFERERDFEKLDDLLDLLPVYGFKLLCTGGFVGFLYLISWFSSPVERFVRQDVQAERDRALAKARELEARSSELQARSSALQDLLDKADRDKKTLHEYLGNADSDNVVLMNKVARYEALPDYKGKCEELEDIIDDLKSSLKRSRRCRSQEEEDRDALASKAKNAQSEINEARAIAEEQILSIKAEHDKDMSQLQNQLNKALSTQGAHRDLTEQRDRQTRVIRELQADLSAAKAASEAQVASQSSQISNLTADVESRERQLRELGEARLEATETLGGAQRQSEEDRREIGELQSRLAGQAEKASRIEELEKLAGQKEAELAALRETMSNDLAAKDAALAAKDAALEKSNGELAAKNADIERIEAQHREVCRSQQTKIDTLQTDLADRDSGMDISEDVPEPQLSLEDAMDVDAAPVHDHSICVQKLADYELRIAQVKLDQEATARQMSQTLDLKERDISQLKQARDSFLKKVSQDVRRANEKLKAAEAALAAEKAGRAKAVEEERMLCKKRFEHSNPLQEKVRELRAALERVTAERDGSREANDIYRKQSFAARDKTQEVSQQLQQTEGQREKLVTDNTTLMGQVVQMQLQAHPAEASGGSRRQRGEGVEGDLDLEEHSRPAKVQKPE